MANFVHMVGVLDRFSYSKSNQLILGLWFYITMTILFKLVAYVFNGVWPVWGLGQDIQLE